MSDENRGSRRILITGGAGFLGSHLCEKFLVKGDEVICMDSLITGSKDNIGHLLDNSKFSFIRHDVTEFIEVEGILNGIMHFASPASPVDYLERPIHTLKVNALGTYNCLGLARVKDSKFFLASTSEIYGDPEVNPQPEDYWGNVNPTGFRSVYDEGKRFAEAITMAYHRKHGIDIRIARIFNTYGPRMRLDDGRALPNFMKQALKKEPITVYGDGSQTRSFCYVDDLIEGIVRLYESSMNEPVNLGNPDEVSILDFAREILDITGSDSQIEFKPLPEDDPKIRRPDISLARDLLDWEPEVTRQEGLNKVLGYFQERIRETSE